MHSAAYQKLKRDYHTHGVAVMEGQVEQMFSEGAIKPEDISLQQLGYEFFGREFIEACDPMGGGHRSATAIMEAGDAVDSTAFANITGQIIFSSINQGFNNADFLASNLVPTIPTRLSGEKIPGVEKVGDKAQTVPEGIEYPSYGFGEEYIETPDTVKKGAIVPVTKEAIFFDRTGLVTKRAGEVGEMLGINKEKQLMDMIVGYGGGATPTFAAGGKWRYKGTNYAVYNASPIDFDSYWYTNQHTAVLTDWTDINEAELLFTGARDPATQEPIALSVSRTLMVPSALRATMSRILNATQVMQGDSDSATVPNTFNTNPIGSLGITGVSSPYVERRLIDGGSVSAANSAKHWFYGDFGKAFAWMENWPITTMQAPSNSEAEFTQDIVLRFKASMRGGPAVLKPHYVVRSTGAG